MFNLREIHFHDSQIIRVIEYPESDKLFIEVEYPTDWQNNIFEHKILVFRDMLNYEIHEGPFEGRPTIIEVYEVRQEQERSLLRIKTNAGFRQLLCSKVELLDPGAAA